MSSIPRNEPCPCGSGKKYKHCHGAPGQAAPPTRELAWRSLRRALEGYPTTMMRFIGQVYGPDAVDEAWDEFTLWQDEDPEFDPATPYQQLFIPWFFHRWAPDPAESSIGDVSLHDHSPTSVLLERKVGRIDPVLRRYLEACTQAPFSFHEVLEIRPGEGFRARDVFTGVEHEVTDRSASRSLERGGILFGQLVTSDGVTLMEACGPVALPPIEKIPLIELRGRMASGGSRPSPDALPEWDIELRAAYLSAAERILAPTLPRLQNTSGEDLLPHRLLFEIESPSRAFEALKHLALDETESELLAGAEQDAEGRLHRVSFAWKVPGNALHEGWENTVFGHIEIDGRRLLAKVNSAERAARLKRTIEESLGEDGRHRVTEIEPIESALAASLERPKARRELASPDLSEHPEILKRIREMTASHYEQWVSETIPALGGATPLEAVRSDVGREKVAALLADMERRGGSATPPLDPAILQRLRERLGFSR